MSNLLFTQDSHHKLQCALPKSKPDNIYITCLIDHPIHSPIFIEQQIIRKGWKYSLLRIIMGDKH